MLIYAKQRNDFAYDVTVLITIVSMNNRFCFHFHFAVIHDKHQFSL